MPETHAHQADARLTLRSQLEDLARVWPWIDALAAEYGIPADTRFKIDLCLEEALSNIVRHGYGGEPDHAITVVFDPEGESGLTFIVEDNAPPFSPLAEPGPPHPRAAPTSIDRIEPGGNGLRLLRKFAGSLSYERLPGRNRLTISFPVTPAIPIA